MVSLFATDYVWDPEWSHPLFIIIPTDISSQAITTVSINRDYVRITPLTIDATPLNYISLFTNRTGNNSLSSIFINEKNLNGTRSLTQQDIQAPSHFIYEEIVETMPTITQQTSNYSSYTYIFNDDSIQIQNQQYIYRINVRLNTNRQNNNWNIDQQDFFYQPDLLEPYTRNSTINTPYHWYHETSEISH